MQEFLMDTEDGKYLNIAKKMYRKYYRNILIKIKLLNNQFSLHLMKYKTQFLNNEELRFNLVFQKHHQLELAL